MLSISLNIRQILESRPSVQLLNKRNNYNGNVVLHVVKVRILFLFIHLFIYLLEQRYGFVVENVRSVKYVLLLLVMMGLKQNHRKLMLVNS